MASKLTQNILLDLFDSQYSIPPYTRLVLEIHCPFVQPDNVCTVLQKGHVIVGISSMRYNNEDQGMYTQWTTKGALSDYTSMVLNCHHVGGE